VSTRVARGVYLNSVWIRCDRCSTASTSGRPGGKLARAFGRHGHEGRVERELERLERVEGHMRRDVVPRGLPRDGGSLGCLSIFDVDHAARNRREAVVALQDGERRNLVAEVVVVGLPRGGRRTGFDPRLDDRLPWQRPRCQPDFALTLRNGRIVRILRRVGRLVPHPLFPIRTNATATALNDSGTVPSVRRKDR
jgi:hypothetical protein